MHGRVSKLYERLHELKCTGDYELIVVPPKEQNAPVETEENKKTAAV